VQVAAALIGERGQRTLFKGSGGLLQCQRHRDQVHGSQCRSMLLAWAKLALPGQCRQPEHAPAENAEVRDQVSPIYSPPATAVKAPGQGYALTAWLTVGSRMKLQNTLGWLIAVQAVGLAAATQAFVRRRGNK
jgi:hypothetical protein